VDQALREYYARWLYKHPYPDDFFRTVESVAGRDLGWFWQAWFRTPGRLAMGVESVDNEQTRGRWRAALTLSSRGTVTMPAAMLLTLENGDTREIRVGEEAWGRGDTTLIVRVDSLPAAVRRAELDPEHRLFDGTRANNVWPRGAPTAQGSLLGVSWAGALGLLALAVASAVLVRAAGLLDGLRLSRFRPARLALGPLLLWTRSGGFRPRRLPTPRLYGPGILAVPTPGGELGRGTAYLASAGPVWSLSAAAVLMAVVYFLQQRVDGGHRAGADFRIDAALFLAGAALAASFLRSLLPRRARGAYLPSAPWLRLLARADAPTSRRWSATRALVAQSFDDVRPRGWNEHWVREATALSDGSAAEAGACMLGYLWALDRGDPAEAALFLERARAAASRRWWRFRIRRHVNGENAFYTAYVEGDAEAGWRLFRARGGRRAPIAVRRRAHAALLIATGERARADRIVRQGLLADRRTAAWGGAGIATFERYWLAVLLAAADQRVGSAVVTPHAGQVALYAASR
jgi:hypothetical protein